MPISLIGSPSSCAIAIAMPPLALPSSFVRTRPVTSAACVKQPGLLQPVLSRRGVDREQRLVRRARQPLRDHPPHLRELLHQVLLRVQAARGVDDHDVAGRARRRR